MFQLPVQAVEPEFVTLFEYWRSKCRDGRLPGRCDIDPVDLPRAMLPNLLLLDVERVSNGLRFRVRLAGTGFVALYGREVTGRYFDELGPAAPMAPLLDALCTMVRTGQPGFLASPLTAPNKDYGWIKRFALPLARDGETVDMVLASFRATAKSERAAEAAAAE
jgi:hypothetical protein